MYGVKVTGVGCCVPDNIVSNRQISGLLLDRRAAYERKSLISKTDPKRIQFESDPDWIVQRTGIIERRHAKPTEATSDLAVRAAEEALDIAGLSKRAVEFIVLATVTPDHLATPPTAILVQHKLGLPAHGRDFFCVDVSLACSSFIAALRQGYALIKSGEFRAGLVIGADVMTRITDQNDRAMFPLLADAAGCFVLEQTSAAEDQFGPGAFYCGADGSQADLIVVPKGGSRTPLTVKTLADPFDQGHTIKMQGNPVFKVAVSLIADEVIPEALEHARITLADIDAMIFHQANLRIIEAIVKRLGYRGIVYNNISRYGNTTSASIPLCYYEAVFKDEVIKPGMKVLFAVFGGGFSWGTAIMRSEL